MTTTLTYDGTLARVRIAVTAIPAAADYVKIERSTDQIQWKTVRGGTAVPLAAGAANLDDYEWSSGVVNYYRVSAVDTSPIFHVATGTAAHAVNASVTPGLPAGMVAGDLMMVLAAIRNSGVGAPNTPTGYTILRHNGCMALYGKIHTGSESAPTVSFTGGVALADTSAQMVAFRNANLAVATSDAQLNSSAQDIAFPALTIPGENHLVIVAGWKQDDWTSVASIPGFSGEIGEPSTVAGDDQGIVWDYRIETVIVNIPAGSFVVTGGAAAISRSISAAFSKAPFLQQETANITPALTTVWLKSLARPFLNRPVTVTDFSDVERVSHSGTFPVVGRSFPVAVTDLHGSRQWTLEVVAQTATEAANLDLLISTGEVQLVHVPLDCRVPGGYVSLGDTTEHRPRPRATRRIFSLPLTEVAAPGADVVGAVGTWQTVINGYADWNAVLAAFPTWNDLLQLVGSPADVIVP